MGSMVFDKENITQRAYSPYNKMALYALPVTILIVFLSLIGACLLGYILNVSFLFIFLPVALLFITIQILLEYKTPLISLFERKRCEWVTEELTIQKIVKEYDFSSPWYTRTLPKLYSKEQNVDQYKLICRNQAGKRVVLRTAMSAKKYQLLQDRIFSNHSTNCTVSYGKYSKIVMLYRSPDAWTDQLNHMF